MMMTFASIVAATILLPSSPTAVEKTAAAELSEALDRIGGAPSAWTYSVGRTEWSRRAFGGEPDWKADEIGLKTVDGTVVLDGHPVRGPLYAVDAFLEDTLGVRWWTSTETAWPTAVPEKVPSLDTRFAPPIRCRETYYLDGFDPVFKSRMKGNFSSRTRFMFTDFRRIPSARGGDSTLVYFPGRSSAYHSFFEILPPKTHFGAHPEWYSLLKGRRCGTGQLCLTNPEMEKAFVASLREILRRNPGVDFVQVSQNDFPGACECAACRAVEAEEGGTPAGPLLRFVNRVAAELEGEFPNVTFDTFAYRFTRRPPTKTRPRRNVTVRLCDIECDFRRPLAELPANADFVRDLEAWGKIAAGQLYVWDYQADFSSYMLPHPNLQSFADNIRLFVRHGAVGVFEQGDALCPAGDFAALKHYVTAHLLWNPARDARQLVDEFVEGYYGKAAAPHIRRALEIGERAVTRADAPRLTCYHTNVTPWFSDEEAKAAVAAMDAAQTAAAEAGEPYARRVRLAKMSWDHARLLNWHRWGCEGDFDAAVREWEGRLAEFGVPAWRETTSRRDLSDYRILPHAERLREKLDSNDRNYVFVCMHRGDWRHAPENSSAAIEGAIRTGADIVELDVAPTKDGHYVLLHDGALDRVSNGKGAAKDLTLAEIRQYRLKDERTGALTDYPILTLEEAFAITKGKILVNLDKYPRDPKGITELAVRMGVEREVIFKSTLPVDRLRRDLWDDLCAGHSDERGHAGDADGTWGWALRQGASMIQTDRPADLLKYLVSIGRHSL